MPFYERPSELPEYGFEAPVYVNPTDYIDFKNGYTDTLNHRRSRWAEHFSRKSITRGRKLKRFCRKGIPPASRPEIWMMVSGAKSRMEASPGLYLEAVSKEPDKKLMSVILADLPRTFPENAFFKNFTDPESKLPSLKRVLVAFAAQFPKVGYCQFTHQGLPSIQGLLTTTRVASISDRLTDSITSLRCSSWFYEVLLKPMKNAHSGFWTP
ncbi:hypothetical protein CRM22_002490 [Opisthorchis felineus]|uniref:Rab-GAP TBC domain-containing protein n=1 Tax=Opisthorchis felineus TaxID=147828 RepID=A0A4S2MC46_OPIFE|nr:hypothetical protein CRM22_002490 [Opisthorchis felineus]